MKPIIIILIAITVSCSSIGKAPIKAKPPSIDRLVDAICKVESGSNPYDTGDLNQREKSHGYCQIKFSTAIRLDPTITRKDLYNPTIAKRIARLLLIQLLERFGDWRIALDAYNKGPEWAKTHPKAGKSKYVGKIKSALEEL